MKTHCYIYSIPVTILLLIIGITSSLFGQFAGGSGTEEDPYLVSNAAELNEIRNHIDKHFRQIADIDLGVAPWNVDNGWLPIGEFYPSNPANNQLFSGSYDGNGYSISNLFISRPNTDYIGLFSLTDGAVLTHIVLMDVDITGAHFVGALAAMLFADCVVSFSSSSGTVSSVGPGIGTDYVHWTGGLIGQINGTVSDSYSTAVVTGSGSVVGGFAGQANNGSTVTRSYSTGSAHGTKFVGGFIGHVNPGTVSNCYTTANASGSHHIGGFTGWNRGYISNSYAAGNVSATTTSYIGGFIARVYLGSDSGNYWDIEKTGVTTSAGSALGRTTDEMTYPYAANTYVGWDFVGIWGEDVDGSINAGYPYLYDQSSTTDTTQQFAGGSGTEEDPYLVSNAAELNEVRNHPDKHFRQIADINLGVAPWDKDEGWLPIGDNTNSFSGIYDGQHFLINNLYINRSDQDQIGLFGVVSGTVRHLLVRGTISGNDNTGGVVGWLAGTGNSDLALVESVLFDGDVTGSRQVGGIAGILFAYAEIKQCGSSGSVTSISDGIGNGQGIGGITGYGGGVYGHTLVEECYSTSVVTGTSTGNTVYQGTGGIIGYVGGSREVKNCWFGGTVTGGVVRGGIVGGLTEGAKVNNCYSYGAVTGSGTQVGGVIGRLSSGTVTNSYYDNEVSGQTTCPGGLGKTTEEMTYPYASETYVTWDFDEVWQEDAHGAVNSGYPYLRWQPITIEPKYTLSLDTNPEDAGTVSGGGSYAEGDTVTVSAEPAEGLEFIHWMIGDDVVMDGDNIAAAAFRYIMPAGNVTLTANFTMAPAAVPVLASPEDAAIHIAIDTILSWSGTNGAETYHIQLSSDADFTHLIVDSSGVAATSLEVNGLESLTTFYWRVRAVNGSGTSEWSEVWSFTTFDVTSVDRFAGDIPAEYVLNQNYPNPFNPSTVIRYGLPERSFVRLSVYNSLGQIVVQLVNEELDAGFYEIIFHASHLPSGTYIYRLQAGDFNESKKLTIVK